MKNHLYIGFLLASLVGMALMMWAVTDGPITADALILVGTALLVGGVSILYGCFWQTFGPIQQVPSDPWPTPMEIRALRRAIDRLAPGFDLNDGKFYALVVFLVELRSSPVDPVETAIRMRNTLNTLGLPSKAGCVIQLAGSMQRACGHSASSPRPQTKPPKPL